MECPIPHAHAIGARQDSCDPAFLFVAADGQERMATFGGACRAEEINERLRDRGTLVRMPVRASAVDDRD
jgi:hypothetical protein